MRVLTIGLLGLVLGLAGCSKDNGTETDRTGGDLKKAILDVDKQQTDLAATQDAIERTKRELADKEKALTATKEQLGSALGNLTDARIAYAAAVNERLAKLDASIATRATKTDAVSKDLVAGVHARRDLLATTIGQMAGTTDPNWFKYTQDVDATFDAIERDLR